jgi:apolipoprotein N-acyltransferase
VDLTKSSPFLIRVLAALVAAGMLSLIAAPYGIHQLTWVIFVPMFWALREDTPRQNRWLAFIYGTFAVATIFRWLLATITIFSNLPYAAALVVLGGYSVLYGLPHLLFWPLVHPIRRAMGTAWVLIIPCLQVLVEYFSMYALLFPFNFGATLYRFPEAWQLLSVTGVWGLTWLIFFVNASIAEAIYRRREGREQVIWPICAALSTLSMVIFFGAWRFEQVEKQLQEAPTVRIAQFQSSTTMQERLAGSARDTFYDWVNATKQLSPGQVDLVVWPEGASPYHLNTGKAAKIISDLAKDLGVEMIVGGGTREREADPKMGESKVRIFNSVYFFGSDGEIKDRYDKMVPLPFGEYLPFAETFPWLADLIQGPGSFRAGQEAVVFETAKGKVATPICYEAILTYVCRKFPEPTFFVNVTNDAWFGDTASTHQHAMLAAVRSTELGIPLYRSAYTGASMAIEPHGNRHSETAAFEKVERVVTLRLANIPTFYRSFGDWFVALCALVLMACAGMAPWRRRQN